MDLKLNKKVVLVTGGSKGIGEAIVRSFAAEGAKVANINRPGPEGEALETKLKMAECETTFIKADLTVREQCVAAAQQVRQELGPIDVVVNNAGVNDGVNLQAGTEEFLASLNRNLLHVYEIVEKSLDDLKQNRGSIINIGSKVATTGQGNTSGYAAAKGAINGLTREWAVDLAPFGVRCNTVIPAEVWTPLYEKWIKTLPNPAETKKEIETSIPLEQRFTTAQEIADMVVFLASPRSAHTTGQIIYVDGGYTHLDRKCTM